MKVPYVQRIKRRDGRVDLYFRKGDFRRGPLVASDGTADLKREVDAILAQIALATTALVPTVGTVGGALRKYNRSSEFIGLAASTQRNYQYMIDELVADFGDTRLTDVDYTLLKDFQDAWSLRGHKACNDLMQVLKNALKPEMKKGTITGRPFADVEKLKAPIDTPEPHPAWEDREVEAAIAFAIGNKQQGLARAIALGRWGGFRRGGICKIPLSARVVGHDDDDVEQKRLYWKTPKRGVICDKPEDPRLSELLDRTANLAPTIGYNKYGQPWKERALNQAVTRLLERVSKSGCPCRPLDIHGLRHARGMELAHAGASEFEIMTQLEHTTVYAARLYIRQANRSRGANSGQEKIDSAVRRRAEKAKGIA